MHPTATSREKSCPQKFLYLREQVKDQAIDLYSFKIKKKKKQMYTAVNPEVCACQHQSDKFDRRLSFHFLGFRVNQFII